MELFSFPKSSSFLLKVETWKVSMLLLDFLFISCCIFYLVFLFNFSFQLSFLLYFLYWHLCCIFFIQVMSCCIFYYWIWSIGVLLYFYLISSIDVLLYFLFGSCCSFSNQFLRFIFSIQLSFLLYFLFNWHLCCVLFIQMMSCVAFSITEYDRLESCCISIEYPQLMSWCIFSLFCGSNRILHLSRRGRLVALLNRSLC